MEAALPSEELRSRARNALFARRIHLNSLLRTLLLSLRRHLTSAKTLDTTYLSLSQILHLARIARDHQPLLWLPLAPAPLPPSTQPNPSQQQSQPRTVQKAPATSPPRRPRHFQTRTFFNGTPIDERRAPAAAWPLPVRRGLSSLSVFGSTASLSTLTSSGAAGTPSVGSSSAPPSRISSLRSLHAYGYSGYRVEAGPVVPMGGGGGFYIGSGASARENGRIGEIDVGLQRNQAGEVFFKPDKADSVALEEIRVRDSVFEIGCDGRIRRQKVASSTGRRR